MNDTDNQGNKTKSDGMKNETVIWTLEASMWKIQFFRVYYLFIIKNKYSYILRFNQAWMKHKVNSANGGDWELFLTVGFRRPH